MSRLFHQAPILCCCILLSMFWLASCSEQAEHVQDVDCNQLTGLFAIADWQSFATGPFVEKKKNQSETETQAPAKNLITGFDNCTVSLSKYVQNQYWDEIFHYNCNAPASTAKGNDPLSAAKAVAVQWQSCFAGWSEDSRSVKMGDIGTLGSVKFSKNNSDYMVSFTRWSYVGIGYMLGLLQSRPVEISITKFIRPKLPDPK